MEEQSNFNKATYIEELEAWGYRFNENVKENGASLEEYYGKEIIQDINHHSTQLLEKITRYKKEQESDNRSDDVTPIADLANQLYEQWLSLDEKQLNGREETECNRNEQEENRFNFVNKEVQAVPIGKHQLPPLPYDYNALEPYINREIMQLHHTEHHQSYVDNLNKAERKMQEAREKNDFELIKHWEREAAFNGAGHYLHTIFWNNMSPRGGGEPKGSLLAQINKDFGSFNKFKQHFSEAAKKVEAVGWAILVWAPRAHHLEILQAEKHQNLSQWDVVPLLALDVWEHAYYLQYKNERGLYVDNWWNVVNWDNVSQRFERAKQLKWTPY
ncbi:superoxide dismutase [Anaerobacillus sp. MEB173]|uniref:superoxide dismutase n=1 Tax=Anaerobacillus sp. MEB173 TaxID=3383345 RepID=UPI003F9041E3